MPRKSRFVVPLTLAALAMLAFSFRASAQLPGLPPTPPPPDGLSALLCQVLGVGCPARLSVYVVHCNSATQCFCNPGDRVVGGGGFCFGIDDSLIGSLPICSDLQACISGSGVADGWEVSCTVDENPNLSIQCLAADGVGGAGGAGGAGGTGGIGGTGGTGGTGGGGGCEDVDGDGDLDCPGDNDNDLECPDEDGDGQESCGIPCNQAIQCADREEDSCCCLAPGTTEAQCGEPIACEDLLGGTCLP